MIRNGSRVGLLFLSIVTGVLVGSTALRSPASAVDIEHAGEIGRLRSELVKLREMLPDQSHAMSDVGYHFTNLWFAADSNNWPLADFYFNETRSHLKWAVSIKPIRKDRANRDVNLPGILQGMENGPLKQLGQAVAASDKPKFVAAYRLTLENCYACHKASEKPYLRPQIPRQPATTIINNDPHSTWPL